jgi:hypothetical protein
MFRRHREFDVSIPAHEYRALAGLAIAGVRYLAQDSEKALVTITVRQLPEGVWLSTSDQMPGLVVETDTRDEAIDASQEVALEIISETALGGFAKKFAFVFV